MIASGKFGSIHLINRDNMGHYSANGDTNIVQELPGDLGTPPSNYLDGNRMSPVYFNGRVYFSADNDFIKTYQLTNGLLSTTPTSQSSELYLYPGRRWRFPQRHDNGIFGWWKGSPAMPKKTG